MKIKDLILLLCEKPEFYLDCILTQFENIAMKKKYNILKQTQDKEELIEKIWTECLELNKKNKNLEQIIYTLELVQENKWMIFLDKLNILNQVDQNILHIQLYQILVQELILKGKDWKPFWTYAYQNLSEKLLSHTEIDYQGLDLNLSNQLSPNLEENSKSWMTTYPKVQNKNLQKTYYQLSISTHVDKWEEENIKVKAMKIRIYPTQIQKQILNQWMKTSNYVYNKTIALINDGNPINFYNLRDKIVTNGTRKNNENYKIIIEKIKEINNELKSNKDNEKLKSELKVEKEKLKNLKIEKNSNILDFELDTPKDIRAGAVQDVCKAYKTCFSNLKLKNINHFKLEFKKNKNNSSQCLMPKSLIKITDKNIIICKNILKNNSVFKLGKKTFKKIKEIKIDHDCRLIYKKNKYWINIPIKANKIEKPNNLNYCGIDPGIRSFLTSFGNNGLTQYKYNKNLINKLNKKFDILKSKRIRKKYLNKIENRKSNLINELHWKSIIDLLNKNDVIFFGDIKSHNIVKKNKNSKLNRDFNDLKLFNFKQRLLYKSNLYNKKVFFIDEHFTTKTCSNCGFLNDVGNKEIINCESCKETILRDLNGAKNILMKGLLSESFTEFVQSQSQN